MSKVEEVSRVETTVRKGQGLLQTYRHPIKGVLTALAAVLMFLIFLALITTVIWLIAK